jgi:hypothetical protein
MTQGVSYSGVRDPNVTGVSSAGVSGSGVIAAIVSRVYPTLNPLDKSAAISLSGNNLIATSSTASWNGVRGTMSKSTGKWYYEVSLNATRSSVGLNTDVMMGVARDTQPLTTTYAGQGGTAGWGLQDKSPTTLMFSSIGFVSHVPYSGSASTRYGVYVDLDAGTISYSFDGVDKGVANASVSGVVFPYLCLYDAGTDPVATVYFDSATWLYPNTYPAASAWSV